MKDKVRPNPPIQPRELYWFKSLLLWCLLISYALILFVDGMREPLYCDEGSFLKNVCYFGVYRTAEPIFVNYPTFFSYLLAVPIYIAYVIYYLFVRHFPWEGLGDPRLFALVFQGDLSIWLWVGRIISILFAVAILVRVCQYCISRLQRPALIFIVFLLIASPYSFYMSYARYALPDIIVAFLVTSILLIASRYIENPQNKKLYFAGFMAGIAASAKLNGLLALGLLLALPWIVSAKTFQNLRLMLLVAGCAVLGFIIGSPYCILKPGLFAAGFDLESKILYGSSGAFNYQWLLPALWREDPAMTVLMIAAVGFSFWRHSKQDMIFHAILIPSVIFLGGLSKQTPYYLLFLFPWICIIVGEFFQEILKLDRLKVVRLILIAGLIAVAGFESYRLVDRVIQNSRPDNRTIARDWIWQNISADEHVLLDLDNRPRMGVIDLRVMNENEWISKNRYPEIVRQYLPRKLYHHIDILGTFFISTRDLKAQGWKYFVTANSNFEYYLEDLAKVDALRNGSQEVFFEFLSRRIFYQQLIRESVGVQVFKDGSGPHIYIFQLR